MATSMLLLQLADVLDRLAVHRDDDVAAGLETGLPGGRGVAAEVLDHHALHVRQTDVVVVGRHVPDHHAKRGALHVAVGDDLVHRPGVQGSMDRIISHGHVERAALGVMVRNVSPNDATSGLPSCRAWWSRTSAATLARRKTISRPVA